MEHQVLGGNAFHRVLVFICDSVERVPAGARLCEPQHSRSCKGSSAHDPYCVPIALVFLTGCASKPPRPSASSRSEKAKQRLAEVFNAAETKDLSRTESYHWYSPHFSKFAGTGERLDDLAAREGEQKGLTALGGLKLKAEDLQNEFFDHAAVARFTMGATIQCGADAITKCERAKREVSWKIVHAHFSAAERGKDGNKKPKTR